MCRVVRRMCFRNERTLYKRKCDAPGHTEELISVFSPDSEQRVYDAKYWWGDEWEASEYGRDVDFSRPFLAQLKELWREVPDVALLNINPVNSDYCSVTEGNKNCYFVFGGDFNEDTSYSTYIFNSKECLDTYWVSKSERNYETIDCVSCTRLLFSRYCEGCYDSAFLFNCKNCHDCFGCINLNNKSYQIFNVQYTKEEYQEKMKEFDLGSYTGLQKAASPLREMFLKYPRRYAHIIRSVNSTGNNLEGSKNCRNCFDIFSGGEDCANVWLAYSGVKDLIDCDRSGLNAELAVDCSTIYPGSRVFYSRFTFSSHDLSYSYNSNNSSYLFGCVGMRNKQYCILNKQYTKEEYEALIPKLIEHMSAMPYVDKAGRVYKYGEFFPPELSPFTYNESIAQELKTLTKAEAEKQGYVWRDTEEKKYNITMSTADIPDHISTVSDNILQATIECSHQGKCAEQCSTAFKIIPSELAFYRAMNIPLPRLCPNCRHYTRTKQRNPLQLWPRNCQCAGTTSESAAYQNSATHVHRTDHCPNSFETTYAPERPEIVYCEQCYQAEVA